MVVGLFGNRLASIEAHQDQLHLSIRVDYFAVVAVRLGCRLQRVSECHFNHRTMPEIVELHLMCAMLKGLPQPFEMVMAKIECSDLPATFTLDAEVRGKELLLVVNGTPWRLVHCMFGGLFKVATFVLSTSIFTIRHMGVFLNFVDSYWGKKLQSVWKQPAVFDLQRGPDILDDPEGFLTNLKRGMERMRSDPTIAEFLLNQRVFNGIGNYLRSEILHEAHVNPFKTLSTLGPDDRERIWHACIEVPRRLFTTLGHYIGTPEDNWSAYEPFLHVYKKAPQPQPDKNGRLVYSTEFGEK